MLAFWVVMFRNGGRFSGWVCSEFTSIVVKISETLNVSMKEALDLFYKSETCRRFHDEETGLYIQGNLYVLNDFLAEISKQRVA